MSTSPYSLDLRDKVIKYLQLGNSQQSASKLFMLDPSTVNRWWLRYKREGNFLPRKRHGREPRVSLSSLKTYIATYPHFTSEDMGKYFGMTSGGAYYWLKKLGYSYKKKTLPMWRQMNKKEETTKI